MTKFRLTKRIKVNFEITAQGYALSLISNKMGSNI